MTRADVSGDLVQELAVAICADIPVEQCCGQDGIDGDDRLIERALDAEETSPIIRLWENTPCLVTTRSISQNPKFQDAAEASAATGWPVFVRKSGGTTVIHRPGILNLSIVHNYGSANPTIEQGFSGLLAILKNACRKLGIAAHIGPVSGSYCDGKYNLCVNNRKMAGTAARIITKNGSRLVVSHASITVDGDIASDLRQIGIFEKKLDITSRYYAASHTTLRTAFKKIYE